MPSPICGESAWRCGAWARTLVLIATSALSVGCNDAPEPFVDSWREPVTPWVEVWRDDFDGPAGSAPGARRWNVEIRPMGQNQELDYDTNDRKNSFLDGDGHLVIEARREHYVDDAGLRSSQPFTSARLSTQGKFEQKYGRFEARIRLPVGGKGIWPAFWMLGSDVDEVGWPACGEVDILEMRGSKPSVIEGRGGAAPSP